MQQGIFTPIFLPDAIIESIIAQDNRAFPTDSAGRLVSATRHAQDEFLQMFVFKLPYVTVAEMGMIALQHLLNFF